ncbi:hypothetical protein [Gimesia sp.]|uniref:hypothetical protein n=1 Tax=Gimesia sp. TaxID=2024833 RepID=UPI003A8C99D9
MEQITTGLILLVECVALVVVLTWPAVKGKACLVGALLAVLSSGVCTLVLHMTLTESGQIIMGLEEYHRYFKFSSFLYGVHLLGKVLFVFAVFKLRTPLKRYTKALYSGNIESEL